MLSNSAYHADPITEIAEQNKAPKTGAPVETDGTASGDSLRVQ